MMLLLRQWLPQAVIITGLSLLIYAGVQQNYRQSLNDPQIQMAEDGAARLAAGGVPEELVPPGATPVDIAKSLSPFIAVYDEQGALLESSAALSGAPPMPPAGLFDLARAQGSNLPHNTWQPEPGVRIALVIIHFTADEAAHGSLKSGFVAAGRNMREVEMREDNLFLLAAAMWGALMTATLLLALIFARLRGRARRA